MTDRPIDPVCGMPVSPEEGAFTAEHDGRVYHFCSRACRDRFVAAPGAKAVLAVKQHLATAPAVP